MQQHTRHDAVDQSGRRPWHPRACVRRAVTLRVDYATADGRGWLGIVRNLSVQGMYIDSALRHVAHEVAPGNLHREVTRSEEHTSELQSRSDLVCRLLLEKKTSATRQKLLSPPHRAGCRSPTPRPNSMPTIKAMVPSISTPPRPGIQSLRYAR